MPHGFNTDVLFDGTVFHVQTERRGNEVAVLESLVYCGGQIVHHERNPAPDDIAESDRRLEAQHRDVARRARHGAFNAPGSPPRRLPGAEGPLQDAVAAALGEEVLELAFEGTLGDRLAGRLVARRPDGKPAAGVAVAARLVGKGLSPAAVWSGTSGRDGAAEVAAALPPAAELGIIFRADGKAGSGRLRVDRAPAGSPADAEENAATGAQR